MTDDNKIELERRAALARFLEYQDSAQHQVLCKLWDAIAAMRDYYTSRDEQNGEPSAVYFSGLREELIETVEEGGGPFCCSLSGTDIEILIEVREALWALAERDS